MGGPQGPFVVLNPGRREAASPDFPSDPKGQLGDREDALDSGCGMAGNRALVRVVPLAQKRHSQCVRLARWDDPRLATVDLEVVTELAGVLHPEDDDPAPCRLLATMWYATPGAPRAAALFEAPLAPPPTRA